ncbi:hypothetical protein BX616_001237 [Lobosporangium transversale]|nr:hypothetical protein BX616_001237 [Lobosporangium transversale]
MTIIAIIIIAVVKTAAAAAAAAATEPRDQILLSIHIPLLLSHRSLLLLVHQRGPLRIRMYHPNQVVNIFRQHSHPQSLGPTATTLAQSPHRRLHSCGGISSSAHHNSSHRSSPTASPSLSPLVSTTLTPTSVSTPRYHIDNSSSSTATTLPPLPFFPPLPFSPDVLDSYFLSSSSVSSEPLVSEKEQQGQQQQQQKQQKQGAEEQQVQQQQKQGLSLSNIGTNTNKDSTSIITGTQTQTQAHTSVIHSAASSILETDMSLPSAALPPLSSSSSSSSVPSLPPLPITIPMSSMFATLAHSNTNGASGDGENEETLSIPIPIPIPTRTNNNNNNENIATTTTTAATVTPAGVHTNNNNSNRISLIGNSISSMYLKADNNNSSRDHTNTNTNTNTNNSSNNNSNSNSNSSSSSNNNYNSNTNLNISNQFRRSTSSIHQLQGLYNKQQFLTPNATGEGSSVKSESSYLSSRRSSKDSCESTPGTSIEDLVDQLTVLDYANPHDQIARTKVFLMIYRRFMRPRELLEMFIARFDALGEMVDDEDSEASNTRLR